MKKLLSTFLLVILSLSVFAQFQGTFIWSIKMEITDPKVKAQMEEANKQMNDPANQAKMKELEEKMNDPQFKAMMEQNPEIKGMIEAQINAIKSGKGGSMMDNMMPKSIEVHLKDGNSLSKVKGGAFEGESLYLKDKEVTYRIDRTNKTYSIDKKSAQEQKEDQFTVTKTDDYETILHYNCRKFIVSSTDQKQKAKYVLWATTDIKNLDPKQLSKLRVGSGGHASFIEKVDGVPLRIEGQMPQGKMTMEVISLREEILSSELFQIPVDFKLK